MSNLNAMWTLTQRAASGSENIPIHKFNYSLIKFNEEMFLNTDTALFWTIE